MSAQPRKVDIGVAAFWSCYLVALVCICILVYVK